MNEGFKTGVSSDDPLGESDDTDEEEAKNKVPDEAEAADEKQEPLDSTKQGESITSPEKTEPSPSSLPWIYARNSITDGRDRTVQLHLQSSTVEAQVMVRNQLEDRLGENVRLADLREAALLTGLEHTDQVAGKLREWGYDAE